MDRRGPAARDGHHRARRWYMGDMSCATMEGTYRAAYARLRRRLPAPRMSSPALPPSSRCAAARPSRLRRPLLGFCYFNNAAIAAECCGANSARRHPRFHTHHGDGTQAIFYARGDVLYGSVHTDPSAYYPHFAGYADEQAQARAPAPISTCRCLGRRGRAFIGANERLCAAAVAHRAEALCCRPAGTPPR